MRRILVPLDGTPPSTSILADARRLAGPGGKLILIRDASCPVERNERGLDCTLVAVNNAKTYLERLVFELRREGYAAQSEVFLTGAVNTAITEAIECFRPDMVACATHARNAFGRLIHRSIAWPVVAHSPVPVLLRHIAGVRQEAADGPRCIMVPLDGSTYAERALPLAVELATEWEATLLLVRVAPEIPSACIVPDTLCGATRSLHDERETASGYLFSIRRGLPTGVQADVVSGAVVPALGRVAARRQVTDIVMASHGRTGASRAVLGSVAADLLRALPQPIIVVPAPAAQHSIGDGTVLGRVAAAV
jgi:nucleotide-binding universal stress UspA family protein